MERSFFEHAAAAELPQEERDRIVRERNWTGEELMTAEDFAIVAPAPEDPPAADEPAQDDAGELRAERDALRQENEALKEELAAAKKPRRRGAKKPEGEAAE